MRNTRIQTQYSCSSSLFILQKCYRNRTSYNGTFCRIEKIKSVLYRLHKIYSTRVYSNSALNSHVFFVTPWMIFVQQVVGKKLTEFLVIKMILVHWLFGVEMWLYFIYLIFSQIVEIQYFSIIFRNTKPRSKMSNVYKKYK